MVDIYDSLSTTTTTTAAEKRDNYFLRTYYHICECIKSDARTENKRAEHLLAGANGDGDQTIHIVMWKPVRKTDSDDAMLHE